MLKRTGWGDRTPGVAPSGPSVSGLAEHPPATCPPLGRSGTEERWLSGSGRGAGRTPPWVTTWGVAWACLAQVATGLDGFSFYKIHFPDPSTSCNTSWNLTIRVFLWFCWVSSASLGQPTALSAEGHGNIWDGVFLSFLRTITITGSKEKSPEIGLNQLETNQPTDP